MRSLTETQDADQLRRSLPDGAIMQYLTGGAEGGRGGSVSPTRQVAWARYSAVCSFWNGGLTGMLVGRPRALEALPAAFTA